MGRKTHVLFLFVLLGLAGFFVSLSLSPLSSVEPVDDLPDWIDDVYLHFDTLRTNLSDYRWPTEASHTMSSAFAEFRRTHFHAGIDISTHGRTGYRVFASRSGFVERILISPFGYGRMLQVRHEDGFTTVYAHLDRFNDAMEGYVRELQYASEKYSLDVRPGPDLFPVAQGDLIAFSGATGVGPPHLHFEIRDERNNPANPLLCPEFASAVTDTRHPEFHQVTIAPFDFTGKINGSPSPMTLDAKAARANEFHLSGVIRLSGSVGLSVKATDRVNATWHRNGIYHYELFLDSTLIYTSKLDRFSSRQTEQIALHYDWPLVEAGEGRFQKLYLEPGNRLPLYARAPERSGVIETGLYKGGYHVLSIVARDAHGNESRLRATVLFDELPVIDVRQDGNTLVVIPSSSADLSAITVASRLPESKTWKKTVYETAALSSTPDGFVVPFPSEPTRMVRVEAKNSAGSLSHPVYICPPSKSASNTSLRLRKEFIRDYLLVTLSSHLPFTVRPSLWVQNGEGRFVAEINASNERTYVGAIPLTNLTTTSVRLDARGIVNGAEVEAYDEFSVFPISPEDGGTITAGNGEFQIDFPPHGVYQPLYCRIERTESGYAVFPQDVLLNLGATIRYRTGPDTDSTMALYSADERSPSLFSRRISGGALTGTATKFLSDYSLRSDSLAPAITGLSVRFSRGFLRIRFGVRDNLSGLDPDGIRLTLDDKVLIAALDPDRKEVVFNEPRTLESGSHLVRAEVRDKMGNSAFITRSFRIR